MLLYLPLAITRFRVPADEPAWLRYTAAGMIVVGLIPLLESVVRFVRVGRGTLMPQVPTEELVISGLYRYVRNPMYVGDLIVLAGEALLFRSWWMVGYAVFVWTVLNAFIRRYEEPTLTRRHGADYVDYCRRVRRWWPRISS
jgi:protein-S-isoprenylcysteine O-methyltransferase Ste14